MEYKVIYLPKTFVTATLALLFGIGFIVTPYWMVTQSIPIMILILALSLVSGLFWLSISGEGIQVSYDPKKIIGFGIVLIFLISINYKQLVSVIAWRGDESFHIERTLELVTRISATWLFVAFFIAGLILFLSWSKPKWAMIVGIFSTLSVVVLFLINNPLSDIPTEILLRYPFLNYWLIFILPKLTVLISNPYQEYLYRLIPVLSIAGVVYFLQRELAIENVFLRFLWIGVCATIPIIMYYTTILYLEPLALVLMLIVCYRIKGLLEGNFHQIKQEIGWYALITIGFIKETASVFLACFIIVRWLLLFFHWKQFHKSNQSSSDKKITPIRNLIKNELLITISVFLPLILYLLLRFSFNIRSISVHPMNLTDSLVYSVIARSYWEQFKGIFILFLGGVGLLLWRKEYTSAFFFIFVVIAYPIFHAVDNKVYVGYSRFNLFVLPPILAASSVLIKEVLSKKKFIGASLGVLLLSLNLLQSPLLPDGTKKSNWGTYLSSVTEEYYPYQEAFAWLAQNHRKSRILFAGYNYPYPFEFYFNKFGWKPTFRTLMINDAVSETATLTTAVEKAELRNSTVIVFHVLENEAALPLQLGSFQREKTFKNINHSIIIYNRLR